MKPKPTITDHEINGFIDNELDSVERAQVLKDGCQSTEVNSQIADYRRIKDLVKNAYTNVPLPRSKMRQTNRLLESKKSWMSAPNILFLPAMGLSLLLIIGVIAGTHVMLNQNTSNVNSPQLFADTNRQAAGNPIRYMLHLSSNEYNKMDLVLTRAESLLALNPENSALIIEVIANSKGIDLMREDTSPFKARISGLAAKGVLFEACSQTMEQLHKQKITPKLISEANMSMTAMQRVANGVKNGGTYESI
jgi:intracellular sulfur oxidation DsrE/DsrF family protein